MLFWINSSLSHMMANKEYSMKKQEIALLTKMKKSCVL